jgi:peptidoglycan/xylan/chitin deacetylase (PgdA/CDA1 family)
MKHTIRDLIIFCIDILGISFLYRLYCKTKGPLVRVVCFHDVADQAWFESVIHLFVTEYHVITPQEFHAKEFHEQKVNILLTFDDGYQSWIDHCLPVLEKYQLKGLFFINSGLLDIADDEVKVAEYMSQQLLITPKKALTWAGAQTLVNAGHTIGGHTVTHPNMALLSADDAAAEITQDKERIEHMLKIAPCDFAYPFGTKVYFSVKTIFLVKRAGYTMQYSAISCFGNDEYVPRTLVENQQSLSSVRSWIEGGYDVFTMINKKVWMD